MPSSPSQLQPLALRAFTALYLLRPSWSGRLVLSLGLDESGAALAVATSIAGGVSLSVDDDADRLREVVRSGTADFVVNSLDEALRAIKNELRKEAPLSVALKADPNAVLAEVLERGLAPHLFTRFAELGDDELVDRASAEFASMGAELISFRGPAHFFEPDNYLVPQADKVIAPLLTEEEWSLITFEAESPIRLRELDSQATQMLTAKDSLRRRWLEAVPRILQRQKPPHRSLWLTPEEQEHLKHSGFEIK